MQANFDRSAGTNGTYTFTMKPNIVVNLREDAVVQARQTIERRVNELGVTEPDIAQQGEGGDPRTILPALPRRGWILFILTDICKGFLGDMSATRRF